MPVRDRAACRAPDGIDLAALARALGLPLALDVEERVACLGASAADAAPASPRSRRRTSRCPTSPGARIRSPTIAARRSCWSPTPPGEAAATTCRSGRHCTRSSGTTASRSSPSRSTRAPTTRAPSSKRRRPTHPALIDTEHRVADLYGIINVPTALWIDEHGTDRAAERRRLRHRHVQGSDRLRRRPPYLDARARLGDATAPCPSPTTTCARASAADAEEAAGRAEFALAWHLHQHGRTEAAARHFARAGELSPDDFTDPARLDADPRHRSDDLAGIPRPVHEVAGARAARLSAATADGEQLIGGAPIPPRFLSVQRAHSRRRA